MHLDKICKSFDDTIVMKDFSIDFPENKVTCILGKSGCGKTSLLNIICNLLVPDSGKVLFDTENPSFSYLFQEPRLFPYLNNLENVSAALDGDIDKAKQYIKLVGLQDFMTKFPSELSGGMKQRLAMARAFAKSSDVILMDEPFQNLDIALQKSLRHLFFELWNKKKSTVIWVTHDIAEAFLSADKIICLGSKPLEVSFDFDVPNPRSESNLQDLSQTISKVYDFLSENT